MSAHEVQLMQPYKRFLGNVVNWIRCCGEQVTTMPHLSTKQRIAAFIESPWIAPVAFGETNTFGLLMSCAVRLGIYNTRLGDKTVYGESAEERTWIESLEPRACA